jgi:hypothetical protein
MHEFTMSKESRNGDDTSTEKKNAFVPAWLDDLGLTPLQFRLYCHISRRGQCWEAAGNIAKACCVNRNSVWPALNFLVGAGLVQQERREGQTSILSIIPNPDANRRQVPANPDGKKHQGADANRRQGPGRKGAPGPGRFEAPQRIPNKDPQSKDPPEKDLCPCGQFSKSYCDKRNTRCIPCLQDFVDLCYWTGEDCEIPNRTVCEFIRLHPDDWNVIDPEEELIAYADKKLESEAGANAGRFHSHA